jgi:hypothetical protein
VGRTASVSERTGQTELSKKSGLFWLRFGFEKRQEYSSAGLENKVEHSETVSVWGDLGEGCSTSVLAY